VAKLKKKAKSLGIEVVLTMQLVISSASFIILILHGNKGSIPADLSLTLFVLILLEKDEPLKIRIYHTDIPQKQHAVICSQQSLKY
jgi:uncharacterized membrane-anchored protein YitT (DUF2179 family)